MVRIPPSAVTRGRPGGNIGPVREVVEIGSAITDTVGAATDLAERLALADRKVELSRMSSSMESSLADLQLEISQNPDLNTMELAEEAFNVGAEAIFGGLGQSTSQAVNEALEAQFLESSLQGRVFVKNAGYKRQADAAIAQLEADSDGLERAYASAPDDEARERIRGIQARNVNLSDYLTEQEKGDEIRRFETATDVARVRGLIQAGLFQEAEDLLNSEQLTGLDPEESLALERTLAIAQSKAETGFAAEKKRINDEKMHAFQERIFDPTHPQGLPTVFDILDADLGRVETEHFIQLVTDEANGVDLNVLDHARYFDLYRRVHLPVGHPDKITDFNQVLPHVGYGVPMSGEASAETLRLDIEQLAKPEFVRRDKLLQKFFAGVKPTIDTSIFGGTADAEGSRRFTDFILAKSPMYWEGIEKGIPAASLLTEKLDDGSANPDYIAKDLLTVYRRTAGQALQDEAAEHDQVLARELVDTERRANAAVPSMDDIVNEQANQ